MLNTTATLDVLVVGGGPAALCVTAALAEQDLQVGLLSDSQRRQRWANTYGIWAKEVDDLGLSGLLAHRWSQTVSHFGSGVARGPDAGDGTVQHGRDYGLFEPEQLQDHWLAIADRHGVKWWCDSGTSISHGQDHSQVHTRDGRILSARLVVDATGHRPLFVSRMQQGAVAGQAAYGVVARFAKPPIAPGQFVFMDYRCAHLSDAQQQEPPTFLYAMHLGDDRYFVEETSLALAPAVPFNRLRQRLQQRLQHSGSSVIAVEHEEFCLFPMNPPLPHLNQRVVGFGGAAGMVHPASGYMVGSLLRQAPQLARAIAAMMADSTNPGDAIARAAWQTLWPWERQTKHAFYRFGLSKLMGFEPARLRHHFRSFFQLPDHLWFGFLTNTLSVAELTGAMVQLFALAPWDVRSGLLLPARAPAAWVTEAPADNTPGHG